ncbi:MAG: hypothetical protein JSW31_11175 [Burkholderiales bacterium]|nr:MAG: hypothetical protein JSW31_11175 [Burkholderiales bacterium]
MTYAISKLRLAQLAVVVMAGLALAPLADAADKRGGGGGARASSGGGAKQKKQVNNSKQDKRTNNVRNTSVNNVNNSVNVNKNVNVNVDNDRGGCCGWDNDYHPVATAAAVTATVAVTSAVIGSIVNAPPPGCRPVNYGGIVYQQCGSTWYMPQGTQFVVVNPPY